ncbi:MAG: PEGA domain-containing protein [Polyangiaceae bacterium]|nr:PEGA domain-containing protein [Polyangiaceae bacterium]
MMLRAHCLMTAFVIVVGASAVACGPPAAVPTVSMRMTGSPPHASVTIDDEFVGVLAVVAARGVALSPGVHHITVLAAGYFPWDKTVKANEGGAMVRLDVHLVPIPD